MPDDCEPADAKEAADWYLRMLSGYPVLPQRIVRSGFRATWSGIGYDDLAALVYMHARVAAGNVTDPEELAAKAFAVGNAFVRQAQGRVSAYVHPTEDGGDAP